MFKPRFTAPSKTNKYYLHTSVGGYNSCIKRANGSCLPNCVGYCWGRAYEILGKKPKLSRGNAENWYNYKDGYLRSFMPRVGSIAVWQKGRTLGSSDGAGHVAVVEEIKSNGDIITSSSNYSGTRFYLKTYKHGNMNVGGNYMFLGYIYLPIDSITTPVSEIKKKPKIKEFKYGETNEYIGKVAKFMRKVFPLYTKKEALGNYLGKNLSRSLKEFQKRCKIPITGNIDIKTIEKLKKYGFKD